MRQCSNLNHPSCSLEWVKLCFGLINFFYTYWNYVRYSEYSQNGRSRGCHEKFRHNIMRDGDSWASFQYPIRGVIVRSVKVSKLRDLYLELSDRTEIWQAPRQHCCRRACQISRQYEHFNTRSRAFETLRDLTIRRLIGYWNLSLLAYWGWNKMPAILQTF